MYPPFYTVPPTLNAPVLHSNFYGFPASYHRDNWAEFRSMGVQSQ